MPTRPSVAGTAGAYAPLPATTHVAADDEGWRNVSLPRRSGAAAMLFVWLVVPSLVAP